MDLGYHPGFIPRYKNVGSSSGIAEQYYTVVTNDPYSNGTYGPFLATTGVDYYSHTGEDVPNFHKRKREGELLPFTVWNQTRFTGSAEGSRSLVRTGNLDSVGNAVIQEWLPDIDWARGLHLDLDLADLKQAAVDSAAANIYSQNWDTLTFLAELHKTVRMFKNFLTNFRKLASDPDQIYKSWLEGRYGWRILMYDLQDIQKALAGVDQSRTRFKRRHGRSFSFSEEVTFNEDFGFADITTTYVDEWDVSVRGNVVADIMPPAFRFNPITTGWELITFSFVIDWIVNIGQWLESLSFLALTHDYRAAGGHAVSYTRQYKSHQTTFKDGDGYGMWSGTVEHTAQAACKFVTRNPLTVSLYPHISPNLDAFKVLDLVALAMQAIRR